MNNVYKITLELAGDHGAETVTYFVAVSRIELAIQAAQQYYSTRYIVGITKVERILRSVHIAK